MDAAAGVKRGRPRNPEVEERVFDVGIDLYGRVGWTGFTFDGISRLSGVGKAAIYRRWSSRADLLADTFKARWYVVDHIDTGDLHRDLTTLATTVFEHLTGPDGAVAARLSVDVHAYPEVRDATESYREGLVCAARRIVRGGMARGELATDTSADLLVDLVVGGVYHHVISAPPELRAEVELGMNDYAETLVGVVIRGVTAPLP